MKITRGTWWASGLEVGAGPMMDVKVAKVSGATYEEAVANANLIAAAPDLLEALEQLKAWVGKLEDWKGEDPPCEIVDAAIKKATE